MAITIHINQTPYVYLCLCVCDAIVQCALYRPLHHTICFRWAEQPYFISQPNGKTKWTPTSITPCIAVHSTYHQQLLLYDCNYFSNHCALIHFERRKNNKSWIKMKNKLHTWRNRKKNTKVTTTKIHVPPYYTPLIARAPRTVSFFQEIEEKKKEENEKKAMQT